MLDFHLVAAQWKCQGGHHYTEKTDKSKINLGQHASKGKVWRKREMVEAMLWHRHGCQ